MKRTLNLVLLGKTGAGKSAAGNTILGREAFISKRSSQSVTRVVDVQSGTFAELPITVYDTPGLCDTEVKEQEILVNYENLLRECDSDLCVFLLVIKADRFTAEERKTVEKIEKILGETRLENTWILFTRGDELEEENMTIQEFINDTEQLKTLVQKYEQRYHVFNNKARGDTEQVKTLFAKILNKYVDKMVSADILKPDPRMGKISNNLNPITPVFNQTFDQRHCVLSNKKIETPDQVENLCTKMNDRMVKAGLLKQNPLVRKKTTNDNPGAPVSSLSSRRIVLLGKSGVGKSGAGNTILGQREFDSVMRMSSVTRVCSEAQATVSGRSVSVVDTPGLFDTEMKPEDFVTEIGRSVYLSSPGAHAFLIVFPVNGRFTEQEQMIPQQIEMLFGQEVLKYSIILFTHGDQIEDECVEELVKENEALSCLVDQCGGRFHVFNNKAMHDRDQVNELMEKIDSMIEQNGGGHYSNQMFEDAQRFRQEEEEQRRREEAERKQEENDSLRKEMEVEIRTKITHEGTKTKKETGFQRFLSACGNLIYMAAVRAGFIIRKAFEFGVSGAIVGTLGGGAGAVCGAVGGAVVGTVIGIFGDVDEL